MSPVQILRAKVRVVEGRLLQADVADLAQREVEGRDAAIRVAVLEFPDQRAVFDVEQVKSAKDAGDTARAILVIEGLVGPQEYARIVDIEHDAVVVFTMQIPRVPRLAKVIDNLVIDGIRAPKACQLGFLSGRQEWRCGENGNYRCA